MYKSIILFLTLFLSSHAVAYNIEIDKKTEQELDKIITTKVIPNQHAERSILLNEISASFLDTPYKANTLIGSPTIAEALVINFNGVDCFTLLDYIHAISHSTNKQTFLENLVKTRYIDSNVSYLKRKHFFSDWFANSPKNANDITNKISDSYITVTKHLNLKSDGGKFIPDLNIIERKINYIPSDKVNSHTLQKLKTGDYIGIYSKLDGLDVSHVGMVIKKGDQIYYRNASSLSKNMKVVDTPLLDYIRSRPGIIVLRSI
ncbi:DUF1460 domain-containing protein [Candidatus Arsenophonus nilaparvatae]|uniref:DUF1460 domain-containing protein n=1 Tax=Candidatus Arsenophonus nilaparvatae TaxID=1247023 RepID=UPI000509F023|nr:DUF1460 domain-containing protein [Candidatus Arsenophonus nilaparvatae]